MNASITANGRSDVYAFRCPGALVVQLAAGAAVEDAAR
jgi:hypothetical protein